MFFHELVGLRVAVLAYPDPGVKGLEGVVVEETEKTLVLDTPRGRVRVFKANVLLSIALPSGERVVLKGEELMGDPAERVKRLERGRGVARLVSSTKHRYPWA